MSLRNTETVGGWHIGKRVILNGESQLNGGWKLKLNNLPNDAGCLKIEAVLIAGRVIGVDVNRMVPREQRLEHAKKIHVDTIEKEDHSEEIDLSWIHFNGKRGTARSFKVSIGVYTPGVLVTEIHGNGREWVIYHHPVEVVLAEEPFKPSVINVPKHSLKRKFFSRKDQRNFGKKMKKELDLSGNKYKYRLKRKNDQDICYVKNGNEIIVKKGSKFEFGCARKKIFQSVLFKMREAIGYGNFEDLRDEHKNSFIAAIFDVEKAIVSQAFVNVKKTCTLLRLAFEKREKNEDDTMRKLRREARQKIDKVLDSTAKEFGLCCATEQNKYCPALKCAGGSDTRPCYIFMWETYYESQEKKVYCASHLLYLPASKQKTYEEKKLISAEDKSFICSKCKNTWHRRCTLFGIHNETPFVCMNCWTSDQKEILNAGRLPTTKRTDWMENQLKERMALLNIEVKIKIRELFATKKKEALTDDDKKTYKALADFDFEKYEYIERLIGVYQEIDGQDVLILMFTSQEYGISNPNSPKNKTLILEYLDSDYYYQPSSTNRQESSEVYQTILLAFFDYSKQIGYTKFNIFVCPPRPGMDYLFWGRCISQIFPSLDRLQEWYKTMCLAGCNLKIFCAFDLKNAPWEQESIQLICSALYAYGGFWTADLDKLLAKNLSYKKFKAAIKKIWKSNQDSLLYIPVESSNIDLQPFSEDLNPCSLFSSRDNLIDYQSKNGLQFDTLQNAKYSSLRMIHDICESRQKNPSTSSA